MKDSKAFHELKSYTVQNVLQLIENKEEESIYLEFKDGRALGTEERKKKEISKDVSAFANSKGGVIIYGLSEKNHTAEKLSLIDGNVITKEWLEDVINSTIERSIGGIQIFPLRYEQKIEQTIYVVKIPKSINAPHMNKEFKFYKRRNFQVSPMKEYEVRQLYQQKQKPSLKINTWNFHPFLSQKKYSFRLNVEISNTGEIATRDYKIVAIIENYNGVGIDSPEGKRNLYTFSKKKNKVIITSEPQIKIYPNEASQIYEIDFFFLEKEKTSLKHTKAKIVLLYADEIETQELNFNLIHNYFN